MNIPKIIYTMSDFVPHNLTDFWEEILRRHWSFLETEESMQKLEERKKLEGYLKEFLCIVPHDRKFFLPETAHVLKKSIKEMDDFSAYKAMIGFESISQYANNLFTKPWRKEYRVIKMYSGFYQHEIKSNLLDADKLFEAMGYKQLPNQILVLDGPICPDQVTNVSRDAMAAYVECQIMKQIFSGLTCMQLTCSWLDVFNFREKNIGVPSQAVKSMAYSIQERRYHKERYSAENCYSNPQSQPVPTCPTCVHQYHTQSAPLANPCNQHHIAQQSQYGTGVCSMHPTPQQNIYNMPAPHHYKQGNYMTPQMSHSKSLEHYGEHINSGGNLPHRHSFDQPYDGGRSHYDVGYDCVDGYQSCGFNAYNHPYNVSGNRYPLPYNISNQLNNQYSSTCGVNSAGHYPPPPPPPPPPAMVSCGHKMPLTEPNYYGKIPADQLYGDCNGYPKKPQDMCNYHMGSSKDLINYRQCTYGTNGRNSVRTEQLIDFDDRPNEVISSHNMQPHHTRSLSNSFDYNDRLYDQGVSNRQHKYKQQPPPHYDIPRAHLNITNQTPKDLYNRNIDHPDEVDGNYIYASQQRLDKKANKKVIDKYVRNAEILEQYEKAIDNNETHSRGARDSYDSLDDIMKSSPVDGTDSSKTKSISNKNQDGVGSFESWDYVFQNLEKHGYKKDLGERGDLLVQGLDLDSMNVSNVAEKRRSRNIETKLRSSNDAVRSKTLEKTDLSKDSTNAKQRGSEKSILKHDNDSTGQKTTNAKIQVQKSTQSTPKLTNSSKSGVNNNHENHTVSNDKTLAGRRQVNKDRPSVNGTTQASAASHNKAISSSNSVNASSSTTNAPQQNSNQNGSGSGGGGNSTANEWSCRFCTYLNPDTKRICEMCFRSKDFNLDANNPPTCV